MYHHKLGDLNNTSLSSFNLKWVSLGQNQLVGRVLLLPEALGVNVSSLCLVPGGCLHSLACDLFLASLQPLASVIISTTYLLPCLPLKRILWLRWTQQENLTSWFSIAKSLLPLKASLTDLEIRTWACGGGHYSACHNQITRYNIHEVERKR